MSRIEAIKSILKRHNSEQQAHKIGITKPEAHPHRGSVKTAQPRSIGERQITHSPSKVASSLAGRLLEEQVRKGRTIEIPSLGIVLTKENLRNRTEAD